MTRNTAMTDTTKELSRNEHIKEASQFLRGTLARPTPRPPWGDVNRNVMSISTPLRSRLPAGAYKTAKAIPDHFWRAPPAYREIWLDGERIVGGEEDVVEPIYGKTYLPRKFK